MPSRLACSDSCDCLVVDPQLFDDIQGNATTDTLVFGTGAEDDPFYFQNVHHPNFVPPSVIVRSTVLPAAATASYIAFDTVDHDPFGMISPVDNTRVFIPVSGYYAIGVIARWAPTPAAFIQPYKLNLRIQPLFTSEFTARYFNGYDENPNAAAQRPTGRTDSMISYPFGVSDNVLLSGTQLRLSVETTENPGLQALTFWVCWI